MLVAALAQYFFGISIFVLSMFLILLVLVQRGRGGGLTGALGGPGGQSAFGTKAGDLFTRITVGVAAVWIFLCAGSVLALKSRDLPTFGPGSSSTISGGSNEDSENDTNTGGLGGDALGTGLGSDALAPLGSDLGLPNLGNVESPGAESTEAEVTEFPETEQDAPSDPTEEPGDSAEADTSETTSEEGASNEDDSSK